MKAVSVLTAIMAAACVTSGCGGGSPSTPPAPVGVSVSPTSATVNVGTTVQFAATVTNSTNQTVTWQVNQNNGGGAKVRGRNLGRCLSCFCDPIPGTPLS